jgi:hypothetical protein
MLTVAGEIAKSEGGLALHFKALAIHELYKAGNQLLLALRELLAVRAVHGDVAQGCGTIVLNVRVRRVQEADQNRNCAGIDQLLTVLIWKRHEPQDRRG